MSIPIDHFGSDFRIGPLTGLDSRVRVQVMHLGPGGLIGRHPTAVQQLFGVIVGEADVSGTDGVFRTIGPGYAALWEEGEDHETRSAPGCTAICIEGRFEMWATAVTREIVVADHDPAWADWFAQLRDRLWPAVEAHALRVDHVGSTAVPGLAAKPVIDMDIVVASHDDVRPVIDRLAAAGYRWRGDLGVAGRECFQATRDEGLPPHNLYLVVENNKAHVDHWLLRDMLRGDPGARERYAALKRQNVVLANRDMDVYVAAKAKLVADLLTQSRAARGLPPEVYWQPDIEIP